MDDLVYLVVSGTTDFPQEEGVEAAFSSMMKARAYIETLLPDSEWSTRFGCPVRWNDGNDYWMVRTYPLDPVGA